MLGHRHRTRKQHIQRRLEMIARIFQQSIWKTLSTKGFEDKRELSLLTSGGGASRDLHFVTRSQNGALEDASSITNGCATLDQPMRLS